MVGYPTSDEGWTDKHDLREVDLGQAARILALLATESLAYGRGRPPRESYRKLAAAALGAFDAGPVFLTSVDVRADGLAGGFGRLTTATFEAGLMAYDAKNAMIFWVTEED
jgi:hypothetical protein